MTDKLDRRQFIKTAAAAGAAMSAVASAGPFIARAQNTNERFAVGVIGCGGQGRNLMSHFQKTNRVDLIALCDVCGSQLKQAHDMTGGTALTYSDFRKLLERKDLDAVIVATPDHWHALAAVATLEAGLDLYVEKPLALSIREGRRIVDAARKKNRVVQCGIFQRSGKMFQQATQMVRDGAIGKVSFCRTWFHENDYPDGIGNPPDSDPPSDLDWNFWLGPAPYVPYNRNRCLYNFRWFWDYSGGKMTDWGTHLIDIVHLGMGVDKPLSAAARGGKYVLQDNRETPDTHVVIYEYPGFVLEFESCSANMHRFDGMGYGIAFYGTEATLIVNRDRFEVFSARNHQPEKKVQGEDASVPHVENFLDCIVSREHPISDVEICHRSTIPGHLGNIALKLGRTVQWDGDKEKFINDPEADAMLMRPYRAPWVL